MSIPIIDLSSKDEKELANSIHRACILYGFFYVSNHGVSLDLQQGLEKTSHIFFSLTEDEKMTISMDKAGKAWRGYFPVMGELTSGKADLKEGVYFGEELSSSHPKVKAGIPMHGQNLFPQFPIEFKNTVLTYMDELTSLGHRLMELISLSLALPKNYIYNHLTSDPFTLFRIFHYPPTSENVKKQAPWGVGEHTDYGLLTILKQDEVGGLQIKSNNHWIEAPYIPNTFICNIGDMLEKLTGGYYVSTPHRVLNTSGKDRYSYPFFLTQILIAS